VPSDVTLHLKSGILIQDMAKAWLYRPKTIELRQIAIGRGIS
jgi:hypothetical protein